MEKKKFQYDYQRFLDKYKITKDQLPPLLVEMIDLIENHLDETKKHCDDDVCRTINKTFKKVADDVMDILFIHVQDADLLPDSESDKSLLIKIEEPDLTPEDIISEQYDQNKTITTAELQQHGLIPHEVGRFFKIGRFTLAHDLFGDSWSIFKGSNP